MASLIFNADYNANGITGWAGTVTVNYQTNYDPATNQTTITFGESSCVYSGKNGYGTSATVNISVAAVDNAASTGNTTLATSGTTANSAKTFTGTPSPASIVIQHSSTPGKKSVVISASAEISVRPFESSTRSYTFTGSKSETVYVGDRGGTIHLDNGSSFDAYALYIDNGNTWEQLALYIDNGNAFEMLN